MNTFTQGYSLLPKDIRFYPGCFVHFYKSAKCLEERRDDRPRKVSTCAITIGRVRLMDHPRKGDQLSLVDRGLAYVVSRAAVATPVSRK